MTPPKPPRKTYMMKSTITSSYDTPQPAYEDPDASMSAVTDGRQSEVKVKPVPQPRCKSLAKAQSNTNNTVDSVDNTSSTNNAVRSQNNGYPADHRRPRPVRPPPKPPVTKGLTSSNPTAAVNGGNQYMNSDAEQAAAINTERLQDPPPPPRPERPPLSSLYYDRPCSAMGTRSKSYSEVSQQSSISSMSQTPVSLALSEEEVNLSGTYGEMATDNRVPPPVPPRHWKSSPLPCSASARETSPPQTRPPPPPFSPPPPPSTGTPLESVYWEIEHRSYLHVLPEDEDEMQIPGRSMPPSRLSHERSDFYSRQQSTADTDDVNVMLRWLKRVSKSDMTPSLYGLGIEEELRSFNQRAMNVCKALRLYNLLMMKRNEGLRSLITEFSAISKSLDKMQKKTKTMGIAGGTTGAVGGVTAVVGIALAPMTMGASLIATAVGAGMVASAGGMGAHAAKANKKIVNRMTVEKLVYEYKDNIVDLEYCLDFILCGMNELRRHDIARLQRAGAQPEALKMAHLSLSVLKNSMNNERTTLVAGGMSSERLLLAFAKEMDLYFTEKDGKKLKKSSKSRFSGRVRLLAENLQDELEHLNRMWEMFS